MFLCCSVYPLLAIVGMVKLIFTMNYQKHQLSTKVIASRISSLAGRLPPIAPPKEAAPKTRHRMEAATSIIVEFLKNHEFSIKESQKTPKTAVKTQDFQFF